MRITISLTSEEVINYLTDFYSQIMPDQPATCELTKKGLQLTSSLFIDREEVETVIMEMTAVQEARGITEQGDYKIEIKKDLSVTIELW